MNPANQDFRVTADGRVLVARETLDRESTATYHFTVVAIDSGKPALSATAQVQIHLGDINDNAPTWLFPPESNMVVNVTIHEPVGHQVALLRATDPDLGENGQIVFKIMHFSIRSTSSITGESRNETLAENEAVKHEMFELDPSTGALYIARHMRPEDIGLVKLLIEASDMGKPNKTSHRTILFNIMDFQRPKYNDNGNSKIGAQYTPGGPGFQHHDLVVIVVMVAVAIVISLFLIIAMLFLRCPICLFHDRSRNNYNNIHQSSVGFPGNQTLGPQHEAYLPEIFRDSHTIGTLGGKDGSLNSGEETLFYQTDRDKIIPSRGSASGKNILTIDYDGTLQDGTLSQYPQNRQFFILTKPDGNYAVSMEGAPIELSTLESHNRQQQQIQQNQQNQTGQQHGDTGQNMRTSQSASCLSAISTTQLTTTSNDYRSESETEDESQSTKRSTRRLKKNTTTDAGCTPTTTRVKAATLGRAVSPSVKGLVDASYYPHGRGGQETLRFLTTTEPATHSGSGLQNSEASGKEKQCYTMLVNTAGSTPSKVSADPFRYVQIRNTPTHLGGGRSGSGSGKKSSQSVSWRMEPHELRTYSPETSSEQTLLNGPRAFVDADNDYARLGKNTDSATMPPYDQLVHRSRNEVSGNNSYSDYSNNVI
nr:hypothetical transcript [Hymenolepis microstoma]